MPDDDYTEGATQTVGDRTEYGDSGLPPELRHPRILAHRDMSGPTRRGYQIIFDKSWMPFDYHLPDGWYMHYAQCERHHAPDSPWWVRMFTPEREKICIAVSEERDRRD